MHGTPEAARRRRIDQRLHRRGDRAGLAVRYLPLARTLALRYRGRGEPVDDLIQVASLGLVKAIERWDPDRGTALGALAVPTILGELRRHFRDQTWAVRPPRSKQELSRLVVRARERMRGELGREPSTAEIAVALGRSHEDVLGALEAAEAQHPQRLDAYLGDDEGDRRVQEIGAPDPGYAEIEARLLVQQLIRSLDRRSREVVRLRFEQDLHQREIAERVGVSQMHVSRILGHALDTLQRHATGFGLGAPRRAAA
jgi:RNA polymerase sigma-B factor